MIAMRIIRYILPVLILASTIAYAADVEYDRGIAYLRAGKAEEALRILEPLVSKDSKNAYLQYHIGLANYKLDRLDKAYLAFVRTGELGGANIQSEFGLASAFNNLGLKYYRTKDCENGLKCFDAALKLDPTDSDCHYWIGLTKAEQKDYPAALTELNRARELKAGDATALASIQNAIGIIYYRQEDFSSAEPEFKQTLSSSPDNLEALYYMGLIKYKVEGYASAKSYFDAIMQKSKSADAKTREMLFTTFFNIGIDFQNRDKAVFAEEMFRKAIGLKDSDADAHFYRGYNLSSLERYEDAVVEFKRALELDPRMDKAKGQLEVSGKFAAEKIMETARRALSAKEYLTAIKMFERAEAFDPAGDAKAEIKDARALLTKDTSDRVAAVQAALSREDYAAAREALTGLIRVNPDSPDTINAKKEFDRKKSGTIATLLASADEAAGRDAVGVAIDFLVRATAIDKDDTKVAGKLKTLRARISDERARAVESLAADRFIQAKRSYEKLLVYLPGDKDAEAGLKTTAQKMQAEVIKSLDRADEAIDGGDFAKAASSIERALELDPTNATATAMKTKSAQKQQEVVAKNVKDGNSLLDRGRHEDAMDRFRAALALDSANTSAKDGLDRARAARDAARNAAREQAQPDTSPQQSAADDAETRKLYLAGVEYYTKGQFSEAITKWRELLKIDPKNDKAITSIARAEDKMREAGGRR